jgi:hypothetical protein
MKSDIRSSPESPNQPVESAPGAGDRMIGKTHATRISTEEADPTKTAAKTTPPDRAAGGCGFGEKNRTVQ